MRTRVVQGHPEEVYACEFLGQHYLLTASADQLFLWDLESGTCLQRVSGSQEFNNGMLSHQQSQLS